MAPPPPPQVAHRHRRRGMTSALDSATHQPRNLRRVNWLELHIKTIPYAGLSLSGVHTGSIRRSASANPRGARVCCSTFACCVSHLHACSYSAANFISLSSVGKCRPSRPIKCLVGPFGMWVNCVGSSASPAGNRSHHSPTSGIPPLLSGDPHCPRNRHRRSRRGPPLPTPQYQ
jgi:hypothetical protein